jgi:hypothetical protein
MVGCRTHRLLRFSTGGALLLLLTAEAKAWPRLLAAPANRADPTISAGSPDPAAAQKQDRQRQRHRPAAAEMFPDAVPARMARGTELDAPGELAGRRAGAVASGIIGRGPDSSRWATPPAGSIAPWRQFLRSADSLPLDPTCRRHHVQDPAIRTVLCRTGPPRPQAAWQLPAA